MSPAELVVVAFGLIAALLGVRLRRAWLAPAAAGVAVAAGLAIGWLRDHAVPVLAATAAEDAVASVAAGAHASAARAQWVAVCVAAAVVVADAAARAARAPLPGRTRWAWAPFGIATIALCCAPVVPPALVAAGPAAAAALAVRRRPTRDTIGAAGLAAALAALAALAGAEATLYEHLTFATGADLRRVDLVWGVRAGLAVLAGASVLLAAAANGGRAGAAFGALAGGGVGLAWASADAAFDHGPDPALAAVHARLAAWPGPIGRPLGGCVVPDGVTVGRPHRARGTVACPTPPVRGAFPDDTVPLVALDAGAPAADLLGWHRGGVGQVAVLVRIGTGLSAARWRVGALGVEAWGAPGGPRARPLPGSVLLGLGADGPTLDDGRGPVPAEPTAGAAARRALGERVRADVLIHESLAPTVQDLVATCAEVAPEPRAGIRCVLVAGDAGAWGATLRGATLRSAPPAEVQDGPPPEVIYDDDVALPP